MQGPFAVAAFLLFIWGVMGLISPRIFKTRTRWVAASLFVVGFMVLAISQFLWPEKGTEAEAGDALLIVTLFFGGITAFVIFLRIAWRANAIKHGDGAPDHWLDFVARPWGNWAKGITAKLAEQREQEKAAPPTPPSPPVQASEPVSASPPPPPPPPSQIKPNPPKPVKRPAPLLVNDEPELRPAKSDGIVADTINAPSANKGRSVWITYVDSNGEVTEREVTNWVMTRVHLEGYCLLRKRKRLFRRDRIIAWGDWI